MVPGGKPMVILYDYFSCEQILFVFTMDQQNGLMEMKQSQSWNECKQQQQNCSGNVICDMWIWMLNKRRWIRETRKQKENNTHTENERQTR